MKRIGQNFSVMHCLFFLVVGLCSLGCNTKPAIRPDQIVDTPVILPINYFCGEPELWRPLTGKALDDFLRTPWPQPQDVEPGVGAFALLEKITGKKVVRIPLPNYEGVDEPGTQYRGSYGGGPGPTTVGGFICSRVSTTNENGDHTIPMKKYNEAAAIDIDDGFATEAAIITERHIIFVILPL